MRPPLSGSMPTLGGRSIHSHQRAQHLSVKARHARFEFLDVSHDLAQHESVRQRELFGLQGLEDDFNQSKNGAQFGAWLGLTPRRNSSGGKNCLGGITKRGDMYLPQRCARRWSTSAWTPVPAHCPGTWTRVRYGPRALFQTSSAATPRYSGSKSGFRRCSDVSKACHIQTLAVELPIREKGSLRTAAFIVACPGVLQAREVRGRYPPDRRWQPWWGAFVGTCTILTYPCWPTA